MIETSHLINSWGGYLSYEHLDQLHATTLFCLNIVYSARSLYCRNTGLVSYTDRTSSNFDSQLLFSSEILYLPP